ncbi:hypothetical protein BGZ61DRAFT_284168, partial [Ilyonectria robusta]|uniref:uncharacterized protein n=1 Tax=Ilyonectria robusta TaxID=1079257 RepID=UPI001E8CC29C
RRRRRAGMGQPADDSSRRQHEDFDAVIHPTPGEIYLAYWEMSRNWSPVLLLPQDRLDNVGVPDTLEGLGLMDHVPKCYVYDQRMKKFKWQEAYENGGPLVAKREFPVMYFDGLKFPERSSVGWVAAGDLRTFDVKGSNSSLVPYFKSVQDFLRNHAA